MQYKNMEGTNMKKFVCQVCGYVYEGEAAPAKCPQCGAPASKFQEMAAEMGWAAEHVVGIASDVPEDIKADLRANFNGECSEVGMYLAMSRVAFREGYPEIGLYWEKAAFEEAEHAAKFAELLGEVVTDSTKKNLEMRVEAENGATAGKTDLAKRAKALNLDAIHDTVHEMARDEARHGKAFAGKRTQLLLSYPDGLRLEFFRFLTANCFVMQNYFGNLLNFIHFLMFFTLKKPSISL